jgi:SAM-dependent methyltransferase
MGYGSEAAKVRELPQVMQYVYGCIIDIGCGHDKIVKNSFGVDGRQLPGVDLVVDTPYLDWNEESKPYDTVFSSHFLEHLPDQYGVVKSWAGLLRTGGHLVLYLPDGGYYNNRENVEHCIDMKYSEFMFWMRRSFCGEAKDFRGDHLPKILEEVSSGMDLRPDCYSFYAIFKRI